VRDHDVACLSSIVSLRQQVCGKKRACSALKQRDEWSQWETTVRSRDFYAPEYIPRPTRFVVDSPVNLCRERYLRRVISRRKKGSATGTANQKGSSSRLAVRGARLALRARFVNDLDGDFRPLQIVAVCRKPRYKWNLQIAINPTAMCLLTVISDAGMAPARPREARRSAMQCRAMQMSRKLRIEWLTER